MLLQEDLKKLVDQAKRAVPAALQSDELVSRGNGITKKAVAERNAILSDLNKQAEVQGYTVRMTPLGITIVPVVDGKKVSQEEFDTLPPRSKKKDDQSRDTVRAALDKAGKELNDLD